MPARKISAPEKPPVAGESGPSFEECMRELETIADAMENEQLPLEELVERYEKGSELLSRCEFILSSAKNRIELINLRSRACEADVSAETIAANPAQTAEPDDENDDIRLF